jgi:predicted sulfurtransferase
MICQNFLTSDFENPHEHFCTKYGQVTTMLLQRNYLNVSMAERELKIRLYKSKLYAENKLNQVRFRLCTQDASLRRFSIQRTPELTHFDRFGN